MIKFDYNKINARCTWCKRTENPHPDFDEPIPTKVFLEKKGEKLSRVCLAMKQKLKCLIKDSSLMMMNLALI